MHTHYTGTSVHGLLYMLTLQPYHTATSRLAHTDTTPRTCVIYVPACATFNMTSKDLAVQGDL